MLPYIAYMDPVGQAMSSWGSTHHTYLVIPTVDGPANCFTKRMGEENHNKIRGWWWWCLHMFTTVVNWWFGFRWPIHCMFERSKPLSPPTTNIWGCWGLGDSPVAEACNQKSPAWLASRNPSSIQKVRELRVPPSLDIHVLKCFLGPKNILCRRTSRWTSLNCRFQDFLHLWDSKSFSQP